MTKNQLDSLLSDEHSSKKNPSKAKNSNLSERLKAVVEFEEKIRKASHLDLAQLSKVIFTK